MYVHVNYYVNVKNINFQSAAHDEVSALDSEINSGENDDDEENSRHSVSSATYSTDNGNIAPKSAFHLILQRSSLARSMKAVFEDLSSTGMYSNSSSPTIPPYYTHT